MKVEMNPCYRCTSDNPRWRGPKLGWLCLECFSEHTDPIVRVSHTSRPAGHVVADDLLTPVVQREDDTAWTLYIFENGAGQASTDYPLGSEIDAEVAVDEAKWILNKRAYEKADRA